MQALYVNLTTEKFWGYSRYFTTGLFEKILDYIYKTLAVVPRYVYAWGKVNDRPIRYFSDMSAMTSY